MNGATSRASAAIATATAKWYFMVVSSSMSNTYSADICQPGKPGTMPEAEPPRWVARRLD
jgi:hypothetical protein